MKIERMLISFPDLRGVYVDHEEHLENYNLDKLIGIEVRVSMNPEEFKAFRVWRDEKYPRRVRVEKRKEEPASSLPDVF
jgi:hypothetical protein